MVRFLSKLMKPSLAFVLLSSTVALGQVSRIELTDVSKAGTASVHTGVVGSVLRDNKYAILAFNSALRRYSLADRKEEAVVFDLKQIPSVGKRHMTAWIHASAEGGFILLRCPHKDPDTGCTHFLFNDSVWTCVEPVEPIAKWCSEPVSTSWAVVFEKAGMILLPSWNGRRTELEIRRLDSATRITQHIKLGGNFQGAWWDESEGLIVLCSKKPVGIDYTLSRVDTASGRVTRSLKWQLPTKNHSLRPMPTTATVLVQDEFCQNYLLQYGPPPKRLISKTPRSPYASYFSGSGQYLLGHSTPGSTQHYILDLINSREIASFDAPNESPLAITNDGRFYLSYLTPFVDETSRMQLIVREIAWNLGSQAQGQVEVEN